MDSLYKQHGNMPKRADDIPTTCNASEDERRMQALKAVFGIWKDRGGTPKDGVTYQKEIRAEWR